MAVIPINGTKNLIHRGRPKGARAKHTRILKQALLYAAEKSVHAKSSNLESYCIWLADEKPELFVSLLGRLIPLQAKVDSRAALNINNLNFNANTPLPEMMAMFAERINSAYVPNTIEHRDPEDEEE